MQLRELGKKFAILMPLKLALSLSMLVLCMLFLADLFSLRGNPYAERQQARTIVVESLAVQLTTLTDVSGPQAVRHAVSEFVNRNADVLAAGLIQASGKVIAQSGETDKLTITENDKSVSQVIVPIYAENAIWGNVRVSYKPIEKAVSDITYFGFLVIGSMLVFIVFLSRALMQLDPSRAVPVRVNSAFNLFSEGVIILDSKLQIMLTNQSAAQMVDSTPEALLGKRLEDWPWIKAEDWQSPWETAFNTGIGVKDQNLYLNSGAGKRSTKVSCTLVGEEDPSRCGVMVTVNDISELEKKSLEQGVLVKELKIQKKLITQKNQELEALASLDPLTGLLNRRKFMEKFSSILEDAVRDSKPLSCIMLDIDFFKAINDNYGHAVGDEVIRAVANVLKKGSHSHDIVGRYGGEEFVVVMPGQTVQQGLETAEVLRLSVQMLANRGGFPVPKVTASLGVADLFIDAAHDDTDAMLERADKALYSAKGAGRNRVVAYDLDTIALLEAAEESSDSSGQSDQTESHQKEQNQAEADGTPAHDAKAKGKQVDDGQAGAEASQLKNGQAEIDHNESRQEESDPARNNQKNDYQAENRQVEGSQEGGTKGATGDGSDVSGNSAASGSGSTVTSGQDQAAASASMVLNRKLSLSQKADAVQAIVHKHKKEVDLLKTHDLVTQLPRRQLFMHAVENEIFRAEKLKFSVGILSIEIKDLSRLVSSFGYQQCEAMVIQIIERIQDELRASDVITRINESHSISHLAENEYGILLSALSSPDQAIPIVTRIQKLLQEPLAVDGESVYLGFNIGIALYPQCGKKGPELLDSATAARAEAATQTEKVSYYFATDIEKISREYLQLESDLYQAVADKVQEVYFQPKFDLATRTISSVEALIRWRHSTRGIVSPADFIPIAEANGLVRAIFHHVLEASLQQLKDWDSLNVGQMSVSVNLSGAQLRDSDLVPSILEALDKADISPDRLEIELTETSIIQSAQQAKLALGQLREAGITVTMDDFGTGYTSLGLLAELPLDSVKIDRSFVDAMQTSERSRAIVESVINMAHTLRLLVVAEGVETNEQLTTLDALGCNEVQGYLISRPLPGPEISTLLKREAAQRARRRAG